MFNKIKILTVAKVGSANFLKCNYKNINNKNKIYHGHNVGLIKEILEKDNNCIIIVGIRNPIDRNLSYLFQTFRDKFFNDVKTKKNNYKGEYCYIEKINKNTNIDEIIDLYFKQSYHNTFNDWFDEFLEITKINNFNKDNGIDFYKFKNNNTIMIYTLEKLNTNEKFICNKLGITNFRNVNDRNKLDWKEIYNKCKNKIKYEKKYLDNLLNTKIMKLFYNDHDINNMYSKYKIKK